MFSDIQRSSRRAAAKHSSSSTKTDKRTAGSEARVLPSRLWSSSLKIARSVRRSTLVPRYQSLFVSVLRMSCKDPRYCYAVGQHEPAVNMTIVIRIAGKTADKLSIIFVKCAQRFAAGNRKYCVHDTGLRDVCTVYEPEQRHIGICLAICSCTGG